MLHLLKYISKWSLAFFSPGEPPIKRKLLPEFDRTEGPNKSSLKASKTTPGGNYIFLKGYLSDDSICSFYFTFVTQL